MTTASSHIIEVRRDRPSLPSMKVLRAEAMKRRLDQMRNDMPLPLCVDLDRTLISTDMTHELILAALHRKPWATLGLLPAMLLDRTEFANRLLSLAEPSLATIPFRKSILEFIRQESDKGRRIVLVSTSERAFAQALANHVGGFAEVVARQDGCRSQGMMARLLCERFGPGRFDYVGHCRSAIPLWQTSRWAILVAPSVGLLRHKAWQSQNSLILAPRRRFTRGYLQAIRPSAWIINAIIFLPIIWAPGAWGMEAFIKTYLAFCVFCLAMSACCILNDLADIRSDRQDFAKRGRALSSGQLSIRDGLLLAGLFLAVGGTIAIMLSPIFAAMVLAYVALALAYSFWLKRFLLVDLFVLTGLCLAPVLWGVVAEIGVSSRWFTMFSAALFLCLASLHRYVGLRRLNVGNDDGASRTAEYTVDDAPMVAALGVAAGIVSALVVALFAVSAQAAMIYRSPELLWLSCPLLLAWTGTVWVSANRGDVKPDIIRYVVSATSSRITAAAGILIVLLARFVDINAVVRF